MRVTGAIVNLVLWLLVSIGAHAADISAAAKLSDNPIVDKGRLAGAEYRIDIPAHWNHKLVVYYHGYAMEPVTFTDSESLSPMFNPLLRKGYAVAQSAYSATGWAIEEAFADSERLRIYFVGKYAKPTQTLVMGMSMGGSLTALTIESPLRHYDGALSLCGAIEPTDRFMQRDFALRAAFDYYFPGVFGNLAPVAADYNPDAFARKAAQALAANPHSAQALLGIYGAGTLQDLGPVIASITADIQEMQQRTHGNPYGNADLVYTGSGDDAALNDNVKRYVAEPRATAYMSRWYTPTGRLLKPMLALHDSGDPLVPASTAFEYAIIAMRAGHANNFVQQYVNHQGHCVFNEDEIGRAFEELTAWVEQGKRPASGKLPVAP